MGKRMGTLYLSGCYANLSPGYDPPPLVSTQRHGEMHLDQTDSDQRSHLIETDIVSVIHGCLRLANRAHQFGRR